MRVVMIHALAESIPPVRLAFGEIFPEAEVINLLNEGLFIDFKDKLTPTLLRRMGTLVTYSAEHGADAVASGPRVGIIASVPATIRDAEHYLLKEAEERNTKIEAFPCLAEDLIPVLREQGEAGFKKRLAEEVNKLAPQVDAVLLSQFSMATALEHVKSNCSVPVLSPPHSSARRLKELLMARVC